MAMQASGVDLAFAACNQAFATRMSNPKLHYRFIHPSGPLILTFAKVHARSACKC